MDKYKYKDRYNTNTETRRRVEEDGREKQDGQVVRQQHEAATVLDKTRHLVLASKHNRISKCFISWDNV